jgi:hypothetical protein
MDNNELLILFPDLRHGWFDAKIKKPMEHISMNTLNTIVANDMENSKLGEAGFDEHDIFSPPSMEKKIYFDDTLPPIATSSFYHHVCGSGENSQLPSLLQERKRKMDNGDYFVAFRRVA